MTQFVDTTNLINSSFAYGEEGPFDHCIIDNFFLPDVAKELEFEFPSYELDVWHEYNNPIEVKKTCNDWNKFGYKTYQAFSYLNSQEFIFLLKRFVLKTKQELFPDIGLHGGGWHIHKQGGKLNTHLDYSIHPKMKLERKLNIIVYLNSNWNSEWGGHLGLWSSNQDGSVNTLIKSIEPKFNRAVIFDTTQNSWHGLPEPITCPEGQYRKSLAIYYLCEPSVKTSERGKALFVPSESQRGDKQIMELIEKRSNLSTAASVYK